MDLVTPLSRKTDDPEDLLPFVAGSAVWHTVADGLALLLYVVGFLAVAIAPALVIAAYRWLL